MAVGGVLAVALILPLGPISPDNFALKNNGDLGGEIGWTELVAEVARIRDSLTPEERAQLGILTGNYGETGEVFLPDIERIVADAVTPLPHDRR